MSELGPATVPQLRPGWIPAAPLWPVDLVSDPTLRRSFDLLRGKWGEVPFGQFERRMSSDLLRLSDAELLEKWTQNYTESSTGSAFSLRGWYQTLYKDAFRGKKILDVGCGLAADTVLYAEHGANVTSLDIVESNVWFAERVCRLKGIQNMDFCYMEDLLSLNRLPANYDAILCCGSFHHAPLQVSRVEAQALLAHLAVGGRWIGLSYPESRWRREGCLPPDRWGEKTDGGAPWVEWHDLEKLEYILSPAHFETVLYFEFHNSDFNWFDLLRRA
jgi:2-polyprenyl-3-methyl-5-hydroxy-6-metoxy-1,4-benzoquinol methylase